jgi:hypothetical protein
MKYISISRLSQPLRRALSLGALVVLCSCSSQYQITLINNRYITTNSKPKLDRETQNFVYKDHKGEIREVSKSKVLKIEPYDPESARKNTYKPEIK